MFNGSGDDDDFNTPSTKSTLAVLFSSPKFGEDQNTTLMYTAPKQPHKSKDERMSTLFCAKIVTVTEGMSDAGPVSGRYGIAIIGNQGLQMYEIILYKTRDCILTRAKISATFNFSIQDYIIGTFYSDRKRRWIVRFKDEKDASEFCDKLKHCGAGITKTNTENPGPIPATDLAEQSPPLSPNLPKKSSNLVEISPTITSMPNKVDPNKVDPNKVDPNKVDPNKSKSHFEPEIGKTKTNLTSRMAKVGLPVLPQRATEETYSELAGGEVIDSTERNSRNKGKSASTEIIPLPASSNLHNVNEALQNQYIQNLHFTHSQILSVPDPINVLATETRLASCETKVNLSQIQAKLDVLLDTINKQNSQALHANDNNLLAKNKVLQLQVENLSSEVTNLSLKNKELMDSHDLSNRYKEQVEALEDENKSLKSKILNYELEMMNLKKEVELCREEKKNTFRLLEQNQVVLQDNVRLQNRLKDCEAKLEEFNKLKASVIDLNKKLVEKEEELSRCKGEGENKPGGSSKNKAETMKVLESQIKDIMNTMYQNIVSCDNACQPLVHDEFKPVLVKHVKSSTFRIINEVQKKFG